MSRPVVGRTVPLPWRSVLSYIVLWQWLRVADSSDSDWQCSDTVSVPCCSAGRPKKAVMEERPEPAAEEQAAPSERTDAEAGADGRDAADGSVSLRSGLSS